MLLARLGLLVFAVSLGTCAWFYAGPLARVDGASPVAGAVAADVGLFMVFALHHSLLARGAGKRLATRLAPPGAERAVYVWTASLLLVGVCLLWQPVPGLVYDVPMPWRPLMYTAQGLGAWLVVRGAAIIGVGELTGLAQARGDTGPTALRTAGPFRLVRHPVYLGWMLLVLAAPTMTAGRALFGLMSSAYAAAAIPWEERALAAGFGDAYRSYARDVRWRLIPGLW